MSFRIATDTTFNGPLRHHWFPADAKCGAFGTVDFGTGNYLYFHTPAEIDELIAELVALRAEMTGAPEPETPVVVAEAQVLPWCPAVTVLDDETLYCDRDAGHPGSHHAPGPDEGSEVAWSDEPAGRLIAEALIDAVIAGTPVKAAS